MKGKSSYETASRRQGARANASNNKITMKSVIKTNIFFPNNKHHL